MYAPNASPRLRIWQRIVAALVVATTLLPWAAVPAATAAQPPDPPEPAARLEVVIQNIYIFDDQDWGEGEMSFNVTICQDQPCGTGFLVRAPIRFGADSGETVVLNRTVPLPGDYVADASIAPGMGFPVYAGHNYWLLIHGMEKDSVLDDALGNADLELESERQWGIGHHSLRGVTNWTSELNYAVELDIRPAPLPDLRPTKMTLDDLPGGLKQRVCMALQNDGRGDAGPFEVALKVDGVTPVGGTATVAGLAAGRWWDACVEIPQITGGRHTLAAAVDQPRAVVEAIEMNNVYEQPYTIGQRKPSAGPARASLTVSGITVNGQVPDGQDDCTAGKNTVAVSVKNAGNETLGSLVTRLVVDGAERNALRQSVRDLAAGEEREVRFDDVKLKQGEHKLTITLDVTSPGAVFDEDTSWAVTATCRSAA